MFELHPQLRNDCVELGDLSLSKVLLVNDKHYPWLILVPQRENISEVFQLSFEDQGVLSAESSAVSAMLSRHFKADKMNVAALGNMVPQLHVHHIVRYQTDIAWPRPIWGVVEACEYEGGALQERVQDLRLQLTSLGLSWSEP